MIVLLAVTITKATSISDMVHFSLGNRSLNSPIIRPDRIKEVLNTILLADPLFVIFNYV